MPSLRELVESTGAKIDDWFYDRNNPQYESNQQLLSNANAALYGNVGANLDTRNWDEIMASDNTIQAANDALAAMYSDPGYRERNTANLATLGYNPAQAYITYDEMNDRVGANYTPTASEIAAVDSYFKKGTVPDWWEYGSGAKATTAPITNQNNTLVDAWHKAESTGDYGAIAGLLAGMTGQQLMATYGLNEADLNYINSKSGTKLSAGGNTGINTTNTSTNTTSTNTKNNALNTGTGFNTINTVGQLTAGPQVMGPLLSGSYGGGWNARQAVGASNGAMMGAGDANYHSSLIKSLRQNSMTPFSTNAGVLMAPNQGSTSSNWTPPTSGTGGAFNPQVLNPRTASPQEVTDWNAYNTYRTNALNSKTPIVSFAEWLTSGKSDGKKTDPDPGWTGDYSGGGGA